MTPITVIATADTTPCVAASVTASGTSERGAARRSRRWVHAGPRCPQCAGPLVFGEGCSLCPVCGHSSCSA